MSIAPEPSLQPARTYLFVPADRPERFAKALACAADRVVIDLEDAVAPANKALARAALQDWLAGASTAERQRLVVRINDEQTAYFDDDLVLLKRDHVAATMLPKCERASSIARLRAACPEIAVLALIESARGVLAAPELAATPGVQRLVFGTVDFALEMDLSGDPVGFDFAAAQLALASRAAGIAAPVAGVTTAIDDEALLRTELARARAHGFSAKLCIHPRQVDAVHAALAPSAAELDWARRVVAASAAAQGAALQLDGRMVDKPVLLRALALLARAAD